MSEICSSCGTINAYVCNMYWNLYVKFLIKFQQVNKCDFNPPIIWPLIISPYPFFSLILKKNTKITSPPWKNASNGHYLPTHPLQLCYTKLTVTFCKPRSYRSSFLAAGSTSQLISPIYSQQDHLTLHWFYSFKVKISDVILTHPVVLSLMFIIME